jgi:drug/metabolite transporter (DMT)-like permease
VNTRAETAPRADVAAVVAAFTAIYLVWGSTFLAIRFAVETIPPFAMMALRCLLGGAILLVVARWRESDAPWPTRREWVGAALVGSLFFVGCHGLLAYAEQRVPSGMAALCLATIPLFVPLLIWVAPNGQRPSLRASLGLLAGFTGVVLLVASQGSGGGLSPGQAALVLFTALCWAAGTVATRMVPMPQSSMLGAAAPLLAGAAVLVVIALLSGELDPSRFSDVSAKSVGGLLYLVVFGTVLTFSAYIWLLRQVAPSRVATYAFVNPAVAVLLGWALAGEAISGGSLLATGVIVLAVAVVVTERRREAPE